MMRKTLQQVIQELTNVDRADLEEMAVAHIINHAEVCDVAGLEAEDHATEDQIRERVRGMTNRELAHLIAPSAWIAMAIAA